MARSGENYTRFRLEMNVSREKKSFYLMLLHMPNRIFALIFSHSLVLLLDGIGQVTCEDHSEKLEQMKCTLYHILYSSNLEKPDADTNSTHKSNIFLNSLAEDVQTSSGVDLHASFLLAQGEDVLAAATDVGETAGVGDILVHGECDIGPVTILLGSAAVKLGWM